MRDDSDNRSQNANHKHNRDKRPPMGIASASVSLKGSKLSRKKRNERGYHLSQKKDMRAASSNARQTQLLRHEESSSALPSLVPSKTQKRGE